MIPGSEAFYKPNQLHYLRGQSLGIELSKTRPMENNDSESFAASVYKEKKRPYSVQCNPPFGTTEASTSATFGNKLLSRLEPRTSPESPSLLLGAVTGLICRLISYQGEDGWLTPRLLTQELYTPSTQNWNAFDSAGMEAHIPAVQTSTWDQIPDQTCVISSSCQSVSLPTY